MLRPIALAAAVLASALVVPSVSASAADVPAPIVRMGAAMVKVTSFHMDTTTERGDVSMDVIRPDTYHVAIGETEIENVDGALYVKRGGSWIKIPSVAAPRVASMLGSLDRARKPDTFGSEDGVTFEDLGTDTLDAKPAHKFKVTNAKSSTSSVLWIGSDDLLRRVDATSETGKSVTLRYSKYNDVAPITAPI